MRSRSHAYSRPYARDVEDAVPYAFAVRLAVDEEAGGSNGDKVPLVVLRGFQKGGNRNPPFWVFASFCRKKKNMNFLKIFC